MPKGDIGARERRPFKDARTGAEIVRLTSADAIHHTLYFSNPSVTADESRVVFVSDRAGGWNLFAADIANGDITQLTDSGAVNPFSAILSLKGSRLYFTSRNDVRALDINTFEETRLARFPDAALGGCSLNKDETRLVTVVRQNGSDALALVDIDGAASERFFEPPRPIGYAQFCPANDLWILYSSGIEQRMWTVTVRGWKDRPIYLHNADQWITHESFLGTSETVMFTRWPRALMTIHRNGGTLRTIAKMNAWHASSRRDGSLIVADTVHPDIGLQLVCPETGRTAPFCYPEATSQGERWRFDTPEAGAVTTATYGPQWTHPHPAFSPSGEYVTFTSDRSGRPQVYLARVPDEIGWT